MLTLAAGNTIAGVAGTAAVVNCTILGMELAAGVETYKVLSQTQLPNAAATQYTVPSATTAFAKCIMLANSTAVAVANVALFINGTAASNQILAKFTLPASGLAILDDSGLKVYDGNGNLFSTGISSFSDAVPPTVDASGSQPATGVAAFAARRDHQHRAPGSITSLTATTGALSGAEAAVLIGVVPANLFVAGACVRVTVSGISTSSANNAVTFRVRIGTTGTSADALVASLPCTAAAAGTNIPFMVTFLITFRTAGGTAAVLGGAQLVNNGTTGVSGQAVVANQVTATVSVDTTQQEQVQFSIQTAAGTTTVTFHNVSIEILNLT